MTHTTIQEATEKIAEHKISIEGIKKKKRELDLIIKNHKLVLGEKKAELRELSKQHNAVKALIIEEREQSPALQFEEFKRAVEDIEEGQYRLFDAKLFPAIENTGYNEEDDDGIKTELDAFMEGNNLWFITPNVLASWSSEEITEKDIVREKYKVSLREDVGYEVKYANCTRALPKEQFESITIDETDHLQEFLRRSSNAPDYDTHNRMPLDDYDSKEDLFIMSADYTFEDELIGVAKFTPKQAEAQ